MRPVGHIPVAVEQADVSRAVLRWTQLHRDAPVGQGRVQHAINREQSYELTAALMAEARAAGFASVRETGIVVNAGATATVNVTVQIAGTATEVQVSARGMITEPSRTDLGSTLDYNTTHNLPLVSRNPFNFILFQPNVSGRASRTRGSSSTNRTLTRLPPPSPRSPPSNPPTASR